PPFLNLRCLDIQAWQTEFSEGGIAHAVNGDGEAKTAVRTRQVGDHCLSPRRPALPLLRLAHLLAPELPHALGNFTHQFLVVLRFGGFLFLAVVIRWHLRSLRRSSCVDHCSSLAQDSSCF